ncbi:ATP-binding protein, partial [Staphylococcus aureus]|uniref:ATP-binding protein n=1 Tax=Staphylococcus aureus TaxID=1280 RepID=UPI00301C90CD
YARVGDAQMRFGTLAIDQRPPLFNLVANAMQAVRSGGRVRLEAFAQDDALVFRVTDDGPGIPAHLREKIWEPFFTTRQRGTGLGLAIVRKRM